MKNLIYYLVLIGAVLLSSCQKDPLSDIEDGNWNNERSIESIKFENQVGQAEVTRIDESTGEVDIKINVDAVPDLSSIKIQQLVLSYDAEASVSEGEDLNFENTTNSDEITVTSPTGKNRTYTITAASFSETLVGTYDITALSLYGVTGPQYGGGAVLELNNKPWVWPETGGPEAELDNTLTFELTGITEEGNTYGTVTNTAGPDGLYADFIFMGDLQTDVNHYYRKIPKGQGEWLRNYSTNTIAFTFPDGLTTTGMLEMAGTQDLGNGLSKTLENMALAFNLNGSDDYDNIYSDYDKFVSRPRKYWVEVKKQ